MTDTFYDDLAPFYHLLYRDWDEAVALQATALADVLTRLGVVLGAAVLDAACGVGTQTIGLAAKGYQLHASDLSGAAVERLSLEAFKRGLVVRAYVDDLRTLANATDESMEAIIACDNSLPHLLSDDDLLSAFRSALRVLKPSGSAIYSVRDYAAIERISPDVRPYGARLDCGSRVIASQVWQWDGDQYDLHMSITRELPTGRTTLVSTTRYYAVPIGRLTELMREAGFERITRHDDVFFQPIMIGCKPAA